MSPLWVHPGMPRKGNISAGLHRLVQPKSRNLSYRALLHRRASVQVTSQPSDTTTSLEASGLMLQGLPLYNGRHH
jgi:hypothetical protein